jgi:hypothetical protein
MRKRIYVYFWNYIHAASYTTKKIATNLKTTQFNTRAAAEKGAVYQFNCTCNQSSYKSANIIILFILTLQI